MPNNQAKQLAHGAMMMAIFTVLIAITYFVPFLSLLTVFVTPLPIAWYSATYDRSKSILVTIAAILLSLVFGGPMLMLSAFVMGLVGYFIGYAIRTKKSKLYLFMSTSIALLGTGSILYLLSIQFLQIDIINDTLEMTKANYVQAVEKAESMTGQVVFSQEELNQVFDMLVTITPAVFILSTFALSFILVSVNLPLLKKLKVSTPTFPKFVTLRLPKAALWWYLIVLSVQLFVKPEVGTGLYVVILNFSVILWVLLTLQGLSFLYYVIEEKQLPPFLKVVAAFASIPLYSFVLLLGVFDIGFNIREYITNKKDS